MQSRGGQVDLSSAPESFQWSEETQQWTVTTRGESFTSDAMVLALAFEGLSKLLPALPQTPRPSNWRKPGSALALADHRHSSLVRSRDHRSGACDPAGRNHPMDVSQIAPATGEASR
jgi:hypothetical protein